MMFAAAPIPAVDPHTFAAWLADGEPLVVLDVREPAELERVALADPRVVSLPLSRLAARGLPDNALAPGPRIVVFCHLGERSASVVRWLLKRGFARVYNLTGGIDAYARAVDPSLATY